MMRVLVLAGADPTHTFDEHGEQSAMTFFIWGHNPDYTIFDRDIDVTTFIEGARLLLERGAVISDEAMDYAEENYSGEHHEVVLDFLREHREIKSTFDWRSQ